MSEGPDRPRRRRNADDPERSFVSAVRWALLPGLALPPTLASLCAGATGAGLALALALPLAALVLVVNVFCWRKVIVRWRALPRPGDDDHGWPRWWRDGDAPRDPGGGPGGITFDWASFERDFWAHVREHERRRERDLIPA